MRIAYLLCAFTLVCLPCACGVQKLSVSDTSVNKALECIQITGDNGCIVTVQESGNTIQQASDKAAKKVIYEALFNGIPGSSSNRISEIKPLVPDASIRSNSKEYFNLFFSSGDYRNYVEILDDVMPVIVKTANGYKVTVTVVVKKELLRKKLENDDIIKSLSKVII